MRKKCLFSEFFLFVFFRSWIEYGEIRSISPFSVQMWENTDQKNSEYGVAFRKWLEKYLSFDLKLTITKAR